MQAELNAFGGDIDERGLPPKCFSRRNTDDLLIVLFRDELGYYLAEDMRVVSDAQVDELNDRIGVTRAQRLAMEGGSIFGFDKPIARPSLHETLAGKV